MQLPTATQQPRWGEQWRSSPVFIVTAMAIALFTDVFLYSFVVPILPYMLETRLQIDASLTQRYIFTLLALSAGISFVVSAPIGFLADKTGSKKTWLVAALFLALVSTFSIAFATTSHIEFLLFMGRALQALASSIIWVLGFSTIADNVQSEHLGKSYGTVSMAVSVGTSAGPVLAGMLLELGGYWVAWSCAFSIIVLDIVLRLLMLERPHNTEAATGSSNDEISNTERAPLLRGGSNSHATVTPENTGFAFYACILRQPQFVFGTTAYFIFACIASSFDTTLPLHVRDIFHWGSLHSGLLFIGLSAPSIVLAPAVGWWKDHIGTRIPVAIGFAGLAPLLWLAGVPGDDRFPWANQGTRAQAIYAVAMTGVGLMLAFLDGTGTIEATQAVDDLEQKHPGIFGPQKGYSRALSISSMGWTLGMFIGPILSGTLIESLGYFNINCAMAVLSVLCAIGAFFCLKSKPKRIHNTNHCTC